MTTATMCILHRNMSAPMLGAMVLHNAFRALLVIVGLLVLVPVQAAEVRPHAGPLLRSCEGCVATAKADRRTAASASWSTQSAAQASFDDGFAPRPFSLQTFPLRAAAGTCPTDAGGREGPAGARLERPPKAA